MNYIYIIIFICISISVSNCSFELKKVEKFYPNGTIKETYYVDKNGIKQGDYISYFENGNYNVKTTMTDNKVLDTIYMYSNTPSNHLKLKRFINENSSSYHIGFRKNGTIHYRGLKDKKDRKIGNWIHFNSEGDTAAISQHRIINGKTYPNQIFIKDTSMYNSKHSVSFSIQPDTTRVQLGDSIRLVAKSMESRYDSIGRHSDFYVIIPEYGKSFVPDFSNVQPEAIVHKLQRIILSVKFYYDDADKSLASLMNVSLKGLSIPKDEYYKTVVFYYKPHKMGKDTIRGAFNETIAKTPGAHNLRGFVSKEIESNVIIERSLKTIYFDIPIEVVE